MSYHVRAPFLHKLEVLCRINGRERLPSNDLGPAAMALESFDGGDEDDSVGDEARDAALDIKEFLHANVSTEASLGDDVAGLHVVAIRTGELEGDAVSDDRRVAVGDVGKGAGVNEYRGALLTVF